MQEQNTIYKPENFVLVMEENQTLYGMYAARVVEILPMMKITVLPKQPDYMVGVCNYKGSVIPVLSLGVICGEKKAKIDTVCVIFEEGGDLMGMSAENVYEIIQDEEDSVTFDKVNMNSSYIKIRKVLRGEKPVFVLNVTDIIQGLKN